MWKRRRTGEYALLVHGVEMATVTKTGTHLDDYPWDWYLARGIEPKDGGRASGVADTMASAKRQAELALGIGGQW